MRPKQARHRCDLPVHRQTNELLWSFNNSRSYVIIQSKNKLRIMAGFLTSYFRLGKHLNIFGVEEHEACRIWQEGKGTADRVGHSHGKKNGVC